MVSEARSAGLPAAAREAGTYGSCIGVPLPLLILDSELPKGWTPGKLAESVLGGRAKVPPRPREATGRTSNVEGELIGGRYLVECLIGETASARVYRARDSVLGRAVALKLLAAGDDVAAAERFRAEARAAARLVHANLLTVIDRGQDNGRDFVVFEYVGGETLRDRLRREGPLSVREVLTLGTQIASALAFAQEKGDVERHVVSERVLLGEAGQVKLADFGIATDERGDTDADTLSGGDGPAAPAPVETVPVAAGGDIQSLGCLLFELLTGGPPHAEAAAGAAALLGESRPDCPTRLRAAIERALEAGSEQDFESMGDLKRELELCRSELERGEQRSRTREASTGVIPPGRIPASVVFEPESRPAGESGPARAPRRPRRLLLRLLVLALLLAALAGAAAVYLVSRRHPASPASSPPASEIHLHAVAAYDPPPGDGREDNARLGWATDGNLASAWETERYNTQQFGNLKHGVGLVVDAGRAVKLRALVVRTDTPGFRAEVRAGASKTGPFPRKVAGGRIVDRSTSFLLKSAQAERYYVLWITELSASGSPRFSVDVNELSAG
ncbi:MAG: serine/threonine-protein kinase [Gaiellaceae bacterium]